MSNISSYPMRLAVLIVAVLVWAAGCKRPPLSLPAAQEESMSNLLTSLEDLRSQDPTVRPRARADLHAQVRVLEENLRSMRASSLEKSGQLSPEQANYVVGVATRLRDTIVAQSDLQRFVRESLDQGSKLASSAGPPWVLTISPLIILQPTQPTDIVVGAAHLPSSDAQLKVSGAPCALIERQDSALTFRCPPEVASVVPVSTVTGNWAQAAVTLEVERPRAAWQFWAGAPYVFALHTTRAPDYAGRATISVSERSDQLETETRQQMVSISSSGCDRSIRTLTIQARDGWSLAPTSISPMRKHWGIALVEVSGIDATKFEVRMQAAGAPCIRNPLTKRLMAGVRVSETVAISWVEQRASFVEKEIVRDALIEWNATKAFRLPAASQDLTVAFQRSDGSITIWNGESAIAPTEWFSAERTTLEGRESLIVKAKPPSVLFAE